MNDSQITVIRKRVERELLLFHPELRTALISDEQRIKLTMTLEALVREVVADVERAKGGAE